MSAPLASLVLRQADALLAPAGELGEGAFDLVVGNPPYVNAIEDYVSSERKRMLRERYSEVRGAADLAAYFLALAVRLVRPGGRVALVLPRALLNSPTAAGLRAGLPGHLRPNVIYAPERSDFFPGAAVFACCVVLGPGERCLCSTDAEPAAARFVTTPLPAGENWWRHVHEHCGAGGDCGSRIADCGLGGQAVGGGVAARDPSAIRDPQSEMPRRLGDRFEVCASLTAADAYDLLPHLVDSADGPGAKLLTTGLIDPRRARWGEVACRYLRRTFDHPRVPPGARLTASLTRRVAQSRRPKVLVAGLAKRFEAVLDAAGEYLGAVSTFSIFDRRDDVGALGAALDQLLAPEMTERLIAHLAANALRGRHITVKKAFLAGLPARV